MLLLSEIRRSSTYIRIINNLLELCYNLYSDLTYVVVFDYLFLIDIVVFSPPDAAVLPNHECEYSLVFAFWKDGEVEKRR